MIGRYCCVTCRAEHRAADVSPRSRFWIGKRELCCMGSFARELNETTR